MAMVALLPVLLPMIPAAIQQVNSLIASLRALGLKDDEIMAHIAQSEAKIDPLILRVSAFEVKRHPDDTGE